MPHDEQPAPGLVYVHEYGMTRRQSAWWAQATQLQRNAFLCSAPVRVACQAAAFADGSTGYIYSGVIHGVPVGKGKFIRDARQAYADAKEAQERARTQLGGQPVPLDLDALGIRGESVDEYATPEGRQEAFFHEVVEGLQALTGAPSREPGQA